MHGANWMMGGLTRVWACTSTGATKGGRCTQGPIGGGMRYVESGVSDGCLALGTLGTVLSLFLMRRLFGVFTVLAPVCQLAVSWMGWTRCECCFGGIMVMALWECESRWLGWKVQAGR